MSGWRRRLATALLLALPGSLAGAQEPPPQRGERAVLIREAVVYLSPDRTSQKLATAPRGREVAILEKSREWLHVFANVDRGRDITGWMVDKGVVRKSTPEGDKIIYGEAVDSESEAMRRGGRRNAAQDAMRLYYRVYEYFPESPLAGESLYRAADINWQIERREIWSRPSAREADSRSRRDINEELMKEVRRKFPGSKWADLAAFHMLDNKICGDWQQQSKCPEREADLYEKYAREHPQSPKTPEALYLAAWRRSALMQLYRTEGKASRIDDARARALQLARQVASQYPDTDWAKRSLRLIYMVEQDIPTYGNAAE